MGSFFQRINFPITNYLRLMDIFDILLVAYAIYLLVMLVKETRAEQLIKGIFGVIIIMQLSQWLQLNTISYILRNAMQVGVVAILVVFQPELRRALEKMGRSRFGISLIVDQEEQPEISHTIEEIVAAAQSLSRTKTGGLIVIERETKISEIVRTGVALHALVSQELLENLFVPNTPLHDGAVVIRENRVIAAACFLPLTQNENLSSQLGTRHRSGIGVTEVSDAVVVIVSEETGIISFAKSGNLTRNLAEDTLRQMLKKTLEPGASKKSKAHLLKRKGKKK